MNLRMVDYGSQRKSNKVEDDHSIEDIQEDSADCVTQRILDAYHVEDDAAVDKGTDTVAH